MIRLINASSLQFEEFDGDSTPAYAVLSHRWGARGDEVTYEDYVLGRKKDSPGFKKIAQFCKHASATGLGWVWVDTCCIDKKSSAELSESINSMFAWYQKAHVCFAYLQDVDNAETWRESAWWQRGWTLQELIAPESVIFCDREWREIGSKHGMADQIAILSRIPAAVLTIRGMYRHATIAQKLSWAAGRLTTRREDRAYSLLGLFHINLPLLYGEGNKAFQRLQIEILQKYSDESLFAWSRSRCPHLVLAPTPDSFRNCGNMAPMSQREDFNVYADLKEDLPKHHRAVHPPRATSWGIEICANARKLVPLEGRPIHIKGKPQEFLWAVTLTTAWAGKIRELPCTILLVRSGPAPYNYKRFDCYLGSLRGCMEKLCEEFDVCELEFDKIFYLQFDADFDY